MLTQFRLALCEAIVDCLDGEDNDKVYAYSDCAFAQSANLSRLTKFLSELQHELWLRKIYFKGAISLGELKPEDYSHVSYSSLEKKRKLKSIVHGYWFGRSAVVPAETEKSLRGIAIQVCDSMTSSGMHAVKKWIQGSTVHTGFYPSQTSKRVIAIVDLAIPKEYLPALDLLLQKYLLECQSTRRTARYYIPLIITWIKSHDFSNLQYDQRGGQWENAPKPFELLVQNQSIKNEMTHQFGAEIIYYALLDKVSSECKSPIAKEAVYRMLWASKRLMACSEFIPNEICAAEYRREVAEKRVQQLFSAKY